MLGRNNPLFDLVNAPWTHPNGTGLAMICIHNARNGYNMLAKELIGEPEKRFPQHPNAAIPERATVSLCGWPLIVRQFRGIYRVHALLADDFPTLEN